MSGEADFKIVRPVTVTDALLTSTTVPEAVVATYAGGTTYAAGDRAGLAPVYGSPQIVYQSVQSGNVGHAQSDTAWWKVVGNVYPPYASGSSCGIGGIVSSVSANVHLLYESLVAGNTGNPLTDATKWLNIGSTNARAMFDTTYGSQTTNAESIVITITPGTLVTSVFLGNLDAVSVTVAQTVSGYSNTVALRTHPVLSWYDWYYEPLLTTRDVYFTIPPYISGVLTITISNPGSTASCGLCVIGQSATLGKTKWGVLGGIISYSGTTTDTFGNTTFLPRANAKKLNFDVYIPVGLETWAHKLLTEYTDMPLVFIGSSAYGMSMVYGYLGEWHVPINISGQEPAPIEVRGLI